MGNLRNITYDEAYDVCKKTMPKEMSDWFDERLDSEQCAVVVSKDNAGEERYGYAMKSRDCTIIMYPNWNCASQFREVTNRLRKLKPKAKPRNRRCCWINLFR